MAKAEVKLNIPLFVDEQLAYWTNHRRDPKPACYVYVIQAKGDDPIKIGIARNVKKRIATLQTGNPRKLELRAVFPGDELVERELHKRLRRGRLLGEWFDGPDVAPFLEYAKDLSKRMIGAYQTTKSISTFEDYDDPREVTIHTDNFNWTTRR